LYGWYGSGWLHSVYSPAALALQIMSDGV